MKKIVFIVVLFILVSCGAPPPDQVDWCKIYDFTADDYGFNIILGQWIDEVGLQTTEGGLSFSYEYPQFVEPSIVYVTVSRPDGVEGVISITTAGVVYGVSAAFTVGMSTDEETVFFTPAAIGDAGKTINISVDAGEKELTIEKIDVRGKGASPFADNPCSLVTPTNTFTPAPTVVVPTSTENPSQTWTPTETFTPTETPTITNTPVEACIEWDFRVLDYGFVKHTAGTGSGGVWTNGVGYVSESAQLTMHLLGITELASVNSVRIEYSTSSTLGSSSPFIQAGDLVFDGGIARRYDVSNGWSAESLSISTSPNYVVAPLEGGSASPPLPITGILLHWSAQVGGTTRIHAMEFCLNPTGTPTPTPTQTATPTFTRTPIATLVPGGTDTRTPIAGFTPNASYTPSQTATPRDTPTPRPTLTYYPSATAYLTAEPLEGTPTLSPDALAENEAEWEILGVVTDIFTWFQNLFSGLFNFISLAFQWFVDLINSIIGFIVGLINGILALINLILQILAEIIGIILLLINLVLGLIGLFFAWVGQVVARLTALINAFFTAPAIPIPGLPQCVSNPMAYDICAIYYVADWTLFKPQSLGAFIVPIILALINVLVVFAFARAVLRVIRKGESVIQ